MHKMILYSIGFYFTYRFLHNNPGDMYLIYDEDSDKMLVVDNMVFRINQNNNNFI
jgi:hypothetical protein